MILDHPMMAFHWAEVGTWAGRLCEPSCLFACE